MFARERHAIAVATHHHVNEVICRVVLALGNLLGEILRHLHGRAQKAAFIGDAKLQHLVNPFDELRPHVVRHAQRVCDYAYGDVACVLLRRIATTGCHKRIAEFIANSPRFGLDSGHLISREKRQQHLLGALVVWRISGYRRRRYQPVEGRRIGAHHYPARREMLGVLSNRFNVFVASPQIRTIQYLATEPLGVGNRAGLP
jgi:hypothetical protein